MAHEGAIYPRLLSAALAEALADTPAVFLQGARQVGKSTLACAAVRPTAVRTLDDLQLRSAAAADPAAFVEEGAPGRPLVIDEVQRVPELLLAIKASIDRDRRPGRFLLTGSADVATLPRIAETLAGRVELLTLFPLARCELARRASPLAAIVAADPSTPRRAQDRDGIIRDATAGGFPEAVSRESETRRRRWFAAYVETSLIREVRHVLRIEDPAMLLRLLRLVAARSTGPRNVEGLAHDTGSKATTVRRYLAVLETIFAVTSIPAWFASVDKRLVKHPKMLLIDSGLLAYLLGSRPDVGTLLETYVGCELQRLVAAEPASMHLLHYRTHRGAEVDWVLEDADGRLIGCEVKAASTVVAADFRGLRDLAEAAGNRFLHGIVWYAGNRVTRFGTNLLAVPIASLSG